MTLLVHACCGECLVGVLEPLSRVGRFAALFFNPNIQPLLEFRRRMTAVEVLCDRERINLIRDDRYDPKAFLRSVPWDRPGRCAACYRLRLAETARVAAERGFEGFTTTLLVSGHQDHEVIRRVGEGVANEFGPAFHYQDWRGLADAGRREARRRSLYRQPYCGCIFSEQERFAPTRLHLYRGRADNEPAEGGRS